MNVLYLILYLVAAICFALAAFVTLRPVTTEGAVRPLPNLVAIGLLAWVLVPLIITARTL